MNVKSVLVVFLLTFPSVSMAFDLGISSSGEDIAVEVWSGRTELSNWGYYFKIIADFEDYQNGSNVTICGDGSISGSTGSGTCSGHGGVSYLKEADFTRLAMAFGPTYWVSNKVQLHAGFLISSYTSDVNIGESSPNDFTQSGVDLGVSFKLFSDSDIKFIVSYETGQKRTSLGVRIPF